MKTLIYTFIIFITLSSCDMFIDKTAENTPINNFDLCWKLLDEHYCFFENKNIDWEATRSKFRDQISNNMSDLDLFNNLASMLSILKDGHVNLRSDFNVSRNWDWHLNYPINFDKQILLKDIYLGRDYFIAGGFYTKLITGQAPVEKPKLKDLVPYFYFPTFSSSINQNSLDLFLNYYKNFNGLIIDIRSNGGGLVSNIETIASRFIKERTLVGYLRYKDGKGHNDFTKKYPQYFEPKGQNNFADKRVVILVNRSVYSAANELAAIMNQFDNVKLMGDTCGGGGGMPVSNQLLNGWSIRYSAHQFLTTNEEQIENGVAPDILKEMDLVEKSHNRDSMLDAAIKYIKRSY